MSPRAPPRSPLQQSSPLSPRNMESLAIPSQQRRQPNRQHSSGVAANSLRLPSLPRFHPANYPSQSNSTSNTPNTGPNSPTAPMSPRAQQRQYSEAQRQLYLYQRELVSNARNTKSASGPNPVSPRLIPLGSPGQSVTPLELEQQQNAGGYFVAGTRSPSANEVAQKELVEKLILEEAKRRGDLSAHMVSQARPRPVASR